MGGRLDLISIQEPDLEMRFPGISRERCHEELHLVDEGTKFLRVLPPSARHLTGFPAPRLMILPFHIPGGRC